MHWKGAPEPKVQHCMGGRIDVVQEFTTLQNFGRNWWWANGIRVEYFPGFTTLQLCTEVQEFMSKMTDQPEEFTGRIIFMSMFNDISWGSKDNEQECKLSVNLVSIYARTFSSGRWSFLGLGSEKKWYSIRDGKPQGEQSWWWSNSAKADTQFSVPRVHCPGWKIIKTLLRWWRNDWNCFSHNYFC